MKNRKQLMAAAAMAIAMASLARPASAQEATNPAAELERWEGSCYYHESQVMGCLRRQGVNLYYQSSKFTDPDAPACDAVVGIPPDRWYAYAGAGRWMSFNAGRWEPVRDPANTGCLTARFFNSRINCPMTYCQ